MAELPAFKSIKEFESGNYERFYMTEQHQECADWRLNVENYGGQSFTLQAHSQYLAGASPVFAGMVAEKMSCSSPIEFGVFEVSAAVAALRLAYRCDVTAASVKILLEEEIFDDVVQIGHKFDFFFYQKIMKLTTPKLLASVSHTAVIEGAVSVFNEGISDFKPVFTTAISDLMAEMQRCGDTGTINDVVKKLSQSPELLSVALTESLTSLSRRGPLAMYSFYAEKRLHSITANDSIPALFTYSFTRLNKGREGAFLKRFNSPSFESQGYTFHLSVELDCVAENQTDNKKHVAVYLALENPPRQAEAPTFKVTLRVVNHLIPSDSWTNTRTQTIS